MCFETCAFLRCHQKSGTHKIKRDKIQAKKVIKTIVENMFKQDSSVPRHTIYQMAKLFSLAIAAIGGNIIHDYTAVLYVHGYMNNNDLY